jgi:RNA-binding protein
MKLTEKQSRHLRGVAHPLKPVITIGNAGLTEAVVQETQRALHDHELIKVKVRAAERETRDAMLASLAQRTASELVHRIGHVGVLYKANPVLRRIMVPGA